MSAALRNLGNREFFQGFDSSEIEQLEELVTISDYSDGSVILKTDQSPNETECALYIVLEGEVAVATEPTVANSVPVARIMKPGELFGLVSFVSGGRHTATCVAKGAAQIASMPKQALGALSARRGAFAVKLHQIICGQLARDLRMCDRRLANALHKGLNWEGLPAFADR